MGPVDCRVCGGRAECHRLVARDADRGIDEYSVALCSACRSGSLENPPSAEVLGRHYDAAYYGSGEAKFNAPMQWLLGLSTRLRARSIRNALAAVPAPMVLDIGCGRGALLAELARLCVRGVGLERTGLATLRGGEGFELRVGELTEQRFAAASFDAAVLWHVLEHLENPQAVLAELGRIIKPGGLLVLAVPNNASWQARLFGRFWFHLDLPRHLHFFGHAGLQRLLRNQGYELLATSTFDFVQNPFGFVQSCLNRVSGGSPNRLYRLLRRGQAPGNVLEILLWMLPAGLLLPLALLETALSAARGAGACGVVVARRTQRGGQAAGMSQAIDASLRR